MIGALCLAAALLAPPRELQVSTQGGVVRIALRADSAAGALVPLPPLARAVGARLETAGDWTTMRGGTGVFRFLPGAPYVVEGTTLHPFPAPVVRLRDTLYVPLAFAAEVLADPARKSWNWNAGSTLLAEGPPLSPLVSRPATTTVGAEARARLPSGLRPGHHVTIDPGHGGTDPGNPGVYFPRGLTEKHVTLAVGLLVRDELERRGVKVTMTRTTDTLINLAHRAPRYCREDCDLFVSIHVNALERRAGYTRTRGFETFFLADARTADAARVAAMENEAVRYEVPDESAEQASGLAFILKDLQTNEFLRESARAAELVQSHLKEVHDGPDRGVKQAGFAVLNTARRPAVLVELGFSTNPDDAELMTTSRGQRALASSIADAIIAYLREFERRTGDAPVEAR